MSQIVTLTNQKHTPIQSHQQTSSQPIHAKKQNAKDQQMVSNGTLKRPRINSNISSQNNADLGQTNIKEYPSQIELKSKTPDQTIVNQIEKHSQMGSVVVDLTVSAGVSPLLLKPSNIAEHLSLQPEPQMVPQHQINTGKDDVEMDGHTLDQGNRITNPEACVMKESQLKRHNDFLQFSLFKANLYQRFPHKSNEIDQVYNEFCMLYESDNNNAEDKDRKHSISKESEEKKEHIPAVSDSPKSSQTSAPFVSKFDVLIEKLKAKLNADNFFNYLQVQQSLQNEIYQSSSSVSNLTSLSPEDLSAYNQMINQQKEQHDNHQITDAKKEYGNADLIQQEIERFERGQLAQVDAQVTNLVSQGQMVPPHHLPLKSKVLLDNEPTFLHSSVGMNRNDPEIEFEKARWVVMTNAQPASKTSLGTPSENDLEKASENNQSMSAQAQIPVQLAAQKRYAHSACMSNNEMYVFGGLVSGSKGGNLQSFYKCSLNFNQHSPSSLFYWEKIRADAPRPRDSHSCIQIHNFLIMFGGCGSGKQNSFNDLNKYDMDTKFWTKLESTGSIPPPREAHIAHAFDNDKMFIFGGVNQDEVSFNDAYVLSGLIPSIDRHQSQMYAQQQQQKQELEQNLSLGESAEAAARRSSRSKDIVVTNNTRLNLRWHKCEQSGSVPSPRDSHQCAMINEHIYIFGGQGKGDVFFDDLYSVYIDEIVDNETGAVTMRANWTEIKVGNQKIPESLGPADQFKAQIKPRARTSHSMVPYKNRYLVVVGGEAEIQNGLKKKPQAFKDGKISLSQEKGERRKEALADVWAFDTYYKRWVELRTLNFKVQGSNSGKKVKRQFEPRMAHTACILDQYVVLFGGLNSNTNLLVSNDLYALSLDGITHSILPKDAGQNESCSSKKKNGHDMSSNTERTFNKEKQVPATNINKTSISAKEIPVMNKESLQGHLQDLRKAQAARQQISGQIINQIINIGKVENNTFFGDNKSKDSRSAESPVQAPPLIDAETQTIQKSCLFPSEDYYKEHKSELALIMAQNEFKLSNHQRTLKSFIVDLSKQIGNPIQCLTAFIDNSVQAYSNYVQKHRLRKFTLLRLDISLLPISQGASAASLARDQDEEIVRMRQAMKGNAEFKDPKSKSAPLLQGRNGNHEMCIRIRDNGPGMSDYKMKQVLTTFGLEQDTGKNQSTGGQQNDYSFAQHGIGLKLNALRLGSTCLIISKTQVKQTENSVAPKEYRVSVGLISLKFLHDANTDFLLAPLVCYKINKQSVQGWEALTPFSSEIFSFIARYARPLFSSEAEFQDYVQKNFGEHGTEIFIMHLKTLGPQYCKELILSKDGDITQNPTVLAEQGMIPRPEKSRFIPLENSLRQQIRFMYLHHPPFIKVHINGYKQSQSILENPYARLYKQHGDVFVALREDAYAIQMINMDAATKKGVIHSTAIGSAGRGSLDRDKDGNENKEQNALKQGVLLYRGNRFIRRLEGPLDIVAPCDDPDAVVAASTVLLSKRSHSQLLQSQVSVANTESDNFWLKNTSHGIVSVYKHKCGNTIPSKTDFCDRHLIRQIRQKVTSLREVKQEQDKARTPLEQF